MFSSYFQQDTWSLNIDQKMAIMDIFVTCYYGNSV